MPLPLTVSCFSKIQIGFTFWYWLTWVVLDKGPLNGCVFFFVLHNIGGSLQGIFATTNKTDEPGAALVLTLESTQVSACSCQSLVSKGRFKGKILISFWLKTFVITM